MHAKFWLKVGLSLVIAAVAVDLLSSLGQPARAATLCVNTTGSSGCLSTIQAAVTSALADANASDAINVAAGSYPEVITINGGNLTSSKALIINGAGEGTATTCTATAETCVGGSAQNGPVFSVSGPTTIGGIALKLALQNLTVQNGHSPDGSGSTVGGININGVVANLSNVAVVNNTGCAVGGVSTEGGIFGTKRVTLTSVIVSGNTGSGCTADPNFGPNPAEAVGGVEDNSGETLTNVTISNNQSTSSSGGTGGMDSHGGVDSFAILVNSVVSGNSVTNITPVNGAEFQGDEVGGIRGADGDLTNVLISGNFVQVAQPGLLGTVDGGAIIGSGASLNNVTISGNSASIASGLSGTAIGGIVTSCGDGSFGIPRCGLTNVTVSGNTAASAGAVGGIEFVPNATNVTVSGNSAVKNGYGPVPGPSPSPTPTPIPAKAGGGTGSFATVLNGTVFANNTADGNPSNCAGTITSSGFNVADDGTCNPNGTTDVVNASAKQLGVLGSNNGLTIGAAGATAVLSTVALQTGNPAIDHIPASVPCPGTGTLGSPYPAVDERGVARPQGTACDSGAFEVQVASTPTSVRNVTVSPSPTAAGATANYTITFTTTSALGFDGTITIVAPDGTIFSSASGAGVTSASLNGGVASQVGGTGTNRQLVLTIDGVSTITAGETLTLTIDSNSFLLGSGVTNPAAGSCTLTLATSSDTAPATSAPYAIGSGGTATCTASATPTPTATVTGGSGGGGFIVQPTPIGTTTSTPSGTSTPTGGGTPTGGTGTPTPTSGPTNFVVGSTLPAGSSIDCSGAACTVHVPAVQGAGAYTVTAGSGVTLSCPTSPPVSPPTTCAASNGGTTLTFTNVAAGQILTFIATGLSAQSSGLTSKARGLLAWLVGDAVARTPADAVSSVGSFTVTGPGGTLASNVPLPSGLSVSVAAGWNLMGGPSGSQLGGTAGSLYTFQASDSSYESFPTSATLSGGIGVWAYFPSGGLLTSLPNVATQTLKFALPANHFIMVGNPTDAAVSVSGADVVDTFNAGTNSYTSTTGTATLAPGQGAWVFSRSGGTLTITPTGP